MLGSGKKQENERTMQWYFGDLWIQGGLGVIAFQGSILGTLPVFQGRSPKTRGRTGTTRDHSGCLGSEPATLDLPRPDPERGTSAQKGNRPKTLWLGVPYFNAHPYKTFWELICYNGSMHVYALGSHIVLRGCHTSHPSVDQVTWRWPTGCVTSHCHRDLGSTVTRGPAPVGVQWTRSSGLQQVGDHGLPLRKHAARLSTRDLEDSVSPPVVEGRNGAPYSAPVLHERQGPLKAV